MTEDTTEFVPILVKHELPRASAMLLTETFLAPGRQAMLLDADSPRLELPTRSQAHAMAEPAATRPGRMRA